MNPLTNMKNIKKLGEQELQRYSKSSWHDQYRDSAWVFIGGLPYDLTEGDIIAVFSQYGEIVNINLIRDKDTGKSKGFCFLCFEDQRSTDLSVDNFNGIKLLGRIIRVDHVSNYKVPKDGKKTDEVTKQLYKEGCAPKLQPPAVPQFQLKPQDLRETLSDQVSSDIKLPMRLPIYIKDETGSTITTLTETVDDKTDIVVKKEKKQKKEKKHKKKKSRKKKKDISDDSSSNSTDDEDKHKSKKKKKNVDDNKSNDEYKRHQ